MLSNQKADFPACFNPKLPALKNPKWELIKKMIMFSNLKLMYILYPHFPIDRLQ